MGRKQLILLLEQLRAEMKKCFGSIPMDLNQTLDDIREFIKTNKNI